MEIISCGGNTQLHSFPDLDHLCSSAHIANNGSDCIFLGPSKLFVRVNKNTGIELLRFKDGDRASAGGVLTRSIATVRKMMIENLYCVACPKSSAINEIAIGLTSGMVRFMDYKKANFTKRFSADRITNGVTFMDFNATDDFLASVFENGQVNVYGMKTNSKLHTLSFDKFTTTKVRFHPTKRFQMAVASYEGGVRLYDTQAKKTLFYEPHAHTAPCREVAMTETHPDFIFSVGYDSVINVFDARSPQSASQINSNYPFESLAIAEDGHHFAVGNLKGYVYGYDLRSLDKPLNTKKIHQSSVTSVAFVPLAREGSSRRSMIQLDESKKVNRAVRVSEGGGQLNGASETRLERLKSIDHQRQQLQPNHDQHDNSFICNINVFQQLREAPLDCLSRLSSSSRLSVESPNSMQMTGNNFMNILNDLSDCNIDLELPAMAESNHEPKQNQASRSLTEPETSVNDSFVNVDRLLKRVKSDNGRTNACIGNLLHRKGAIDSLEHIREEGSDIGNGNEATESSKSGSSNNSSTDTTSSTSTSNHDKLSVGRVLTEIQHEKIANAPQHDTKKLSSLPNETASCVLDGKPDKEKKTRPTLVGFKQMAQNASTPEPSPGGSLVTDTYRESCNHNGEHQPPARDHLSHEIAELQRMMLDQFDISKHQHLDAEQAIKSHLYIGMFKLWRATQEKLESLERTVSTGFGVLLPRDDFAQEFLKMRAENEALRKKLKEVEGQRRRGN